MIARARFSMTISCPNCGLSDSVNINCSNHIVIKELYEN